MADVGLQSSRSFLGEPGDDGFGVPESAEEAGATKALSYGASGGGSSDGGEGSPTTVAEDPPADTGFTCDGNDGVASTPLAAVCCTNARRAGPASS